ncbi:MAG TPA: SagB/ThcOx family dehydrogenase [Candidatus Methylomirabilis sp.]|nr:SagB/ThcOx family dehydrogenase [Candidatus Methylomirabilis sp.]
MTDSLDVVLAYHQRTKHHLHRYAAGPGGLDWKNQPEPFRQFAGSPQLELPLLADGAQPRYVDLYRPRAIAPRALTLTTLAALLELAFGLSAWKQYGHSRWALRCNPSSGNLHPTEAYVVVAGIADIEDGVHHYLSRDHSLEQRCRFDRAPGERLLPPDSFLVGITSIHWREAWKYGERAYRYCQHDAGHAIATVRYAAATLGWQARLLTSCGDADLGALLGLDRDADFGAAEREHPDALMLVTARGPGRTGDDFAADACVRAARRCRWQGRANALSPKHGDDWPVIDEVAQACAKPPTQEDSWQAPTLPEPPVSDCERSAIEIIKQRRSAQAFDGVTSLTTHDFFRMLDMTLPRPATPPWDAISGEPRVHLALFVHRVESLAPGLYLFLRNDHVETTLRPELSAEFEWQRVQGCPAHLRLFQLAAGDARAAACALSCHQDIAADGAFSLGMLAEYDTSLARGPWVYRQLFWETGIVGQVLYLEAEAAGVRGTGIGCYFDDTMHEVLGLKGRAFQSLYHFTVGGAIADTRLQTLPAYVHLKRS